MKPKMLAKISIDLGMVILLLLLMAYERIGQAAHEWLGIGMFVLFLLHQMLNRSWYSVLFKGRYTALRIWQTLLVLAVFAAMLGAMVSGVILSRHALRFLPISGGRSFARLLHLLSTWWGFVVMGLHLGFHWQMLQGLAGYPSKQAQNAARLWAYRLPGILLVLYGGYAFVRRNIADYLFLQTQFVFFDFEESVFLLLFDHAAMLAMFVWIGHFLTRLLRGGQKSKIHLWPK